MGESYLITTPFSSLPQYPINQLVEWTIPNINSYSGTWYSGNYSLLSPCTYVEVLKGTGYSDLSYEISSGSGFYSTPFIVTKGNNHYVYDSSEDRRWVTQVMFYVNSDGKSVKFHITLNGVNVGSSASGTLLLKLYK